MIRDFLLRYPLYALLERERLDTWLTSGSEAALALGEKVFQVGSAASWTYVLLEGRVRILKPLDDGRELPVGTLQAGDLFGEYGLLPPHRNTVTCRTSSAVRLLRLPLEGLKPMLAVLPGMRHRLKDWLRLHSLLAFLRGRAFLGFLSAPSALKFHESLEPASFAPAQSIQADGLSSDRWFVIEEGRVQLEAEGSAEPPRWLGAGDCFGERALLGKSGLPVATALTAARCLQLRRAIFAPDDRHATFGQTALADLRETFPFVAQQDEADCGLAALAMVLRRHGLSIDLTELRRLAATDAHGASLTELQRLGQALGLSCTAVRVSADQLHLVEPPVIAHMAEGHYVAVFQHGPEGVVAGDPASGIVRLSWPQFGHAFSGNLLLARSRHS